MCTHTLIRPRTVRSRNGPTWQTCGATKKYDRSVLTWAGTGYAMQGGHPDLLDRALGLRVAPPAAEDGVGQVVERLLRG